MPEQKRKDKLSTSLQKGSYQALREFFEEQSEYLSQFKENYAGLTEEDLEIEEDLQRDFQRLDEQTRTRLMQKIPIPVLYRIVGVKSKDEAKESAMKNFYNLIQVKPK